MIKKLCWRNLDIENIQNNRHKRSILKLIRQTYNSVQDNMNNFQKDQFKKIILKCPYIAKLISQARDILII